MANPMPDWPVTSLPVSGFTHNLKPLQAREEDFTKKDEDRAFSPRIQQMYEEEGGRAAMMAKVSTT